METTAVDPDNFVPSFEAVKRGGSHLVYVSGFKYRRVSANKLSKHFACVTRKTTSCPATPRLNLRTNKAKFINSATAHKLGVDFDLETLTIQLKDRENIFFLLDQARMLKLTRNAFKAHRIRE